MIEILRGTGWRLARVIRSKKGPAYVALIEKEENDLQRLLRVGSDFCCVGS